MWWPNRVKSPERWYFRGAEHMQVVLGIHAIHDAARTLGMLARRIRRRNYCVWSILALKNESSWVRGELISFVFTVMQILSW
ncbi:hypothetical protein EJ08DRAFT_648092 [Tothia fuscella]|uniref:Uncharacterized protein n=1 Tax=Tothia fuscella TaxID=1048955 RepID=A0A9P4NWM8_9PEZI|nr:hypothetical protein EJ08DRAFT_648092 [Tothia fuscella]